ncbi:hypothetical protein FKP32DRAFT_1676097 [Trametes sanguinea]|nr:hypothetical protein FKP32DRAFT_1676097 [Trametes sanguinea]
MLAPAHLSAGKTVSFASAAADCRPLTLTIVKSFEPFTKSVVLLVQANELGPQPVIMKIYDPRFLDERLIENPYQRARPWSLAAETAANAIDTQTFDERMLDEPEPDDADVEGNLARNALWEKYFRILSERCFEHECKAYHLLQQFQGSVMPHLLFVGSLIPSDERAINPPAIIIEYIPDAAPLRDIAPSHLDMELCTPLVQAIDTFFRHGVLHTDINPNNVLFAPKDRPTRAVIIDFGCAHFKVHCDTEDLWWFQVTFFNDSLQIRKLLKQKGIDFPDFAEVEEGRMPGMPCPEPPT